MTSSAYTRLEWRPWPMVYMQCPQGVRGKMHIYHREVKEMNWSILLSDAVLMPGCSVLGDQLSANKKSTILKLDNNREDPPCVAVLWRSCLVCWLLRQALSRGDICVPCFPHFAVDLNVQALQLGDCHLNWQTGISAARLTLNAALPGLWRQRLVALGSETNKAELNKPRAPVGLLDQRQY